MALRPYLTIGLPFRVLNRQASIQLSAVRIDKETLRLPVEEMMQF